MSSQAFNLGHVTFITITDESYLLPTTTQCFHVHSRFL
nr:MAG TPA: hypothetical protein [Caudoviricetes sp.]